MSAKKENKEQEQSLKENKAVAECGKELDELLKRHNCSLLVKMEESHALGSIVYVPKIILGLNKGN